MAERVDKNQPIELKLTMHGRMRGKFQDTLGNLCVIEELPAPGGLGLGVARLGGEMSLTRQMLASLMPHFQRYVDFGSLKESEDETKRTEVVESLKLRIAEQVIPFMDTFASRYRKDEGGRSIRSEETGLHLKVWANSRKTKGIVDSVGIKIMDFGRDEDLESLIRRNYGAMMINELEISLSKQNPHEFGRGKLIRHNYSERKSPDDPDLSYISAEVVKAIIERIPQTI